ncbi:CocE/NonD family hydrolase [Sphingomonas sp. IC-56]|uniref:CocE/NonD family hydrolase n=1 Tax=Sphingomonas sp. IC-56 TaxID=2898529 RepID=UPI001E65CFA6|nr:CocE/NonD family hydrolase [Sphingomonas sp. IC-56]MCD2322851.1 CocE/NonD family hydrolase [Sphingomonas sp. IC-56]
MIRSVVALLIATAPAAALAQKAPSFGHYAPALQYKDAVVTSEYVTMRDGVRIAVSVTRPAIDGKPAPGRFPVIWTGSLDIRSPYKTGSIAAEDGTFSAFRGAYGVGSIVGHGYVLVTAARRGSGASFGKRRGYQDRNEAHDAYEINEWAARQPWSSGKTAIYGCSNTGEAVMHAMTVLPPSLKAVFAGCFNWNKFDGFTRGGMIANWGTGPSRTLEEDMKSTPLEGDDDRVLLRQAAEEHQGASNLFDLMASMPYRDSFSPLTFSRFWGEGSVSSYKPQLDTSKVATYIMGGWYDDFRAQGLIAQANLPNRPKIIIGPWTHCATTGHEQLVATEVLRFFDQHLKGIDTGTTRDAPVHYFTINAPEGAGWRSAARFPLPGTQMRAFHLGGENRLAAQPGKAAATSFTVRREGKCPGAGGAAAQPCHIPGLGASWSMGVAADTEITGHPTVDLWIVSDAPDEHVFAYLEDVAPDGKVTVVTEGRLKASIRKVTPAPWDNAGLPWHRGYAEDAQSLTPGEPAPLQFAMLPASYVFRKGHRLQVTVTGWDPRERQAPKTASRIRILNDEKHRSTVTLPYAPAAYSAAVASR